jgi:hypothetical protein
MQIGKKNKEQGVEMIHMEAEDSRRRNVDDGV